MNNNINEVLNKYGFNSMKELEEDISKRIDEGETFRKITQVRINSKGKLAVEYEANRNPKKKYYPKVIPCLREYDVK